MTTTTTPEATPEPITEVIFRVWRAQPRTVIALFPYDIETRQGHCGSFEHIGQHGAADYAGVIQATRPATPDEYAPLAAELQSYPYNYRLKPIKRAQYAKIAEAYRASRSR